MYRCVLQSHDIIQHHFLWQASTVHRQGQISSIHITLFTQLPKSSVREPSVNFSVTQSGDQCQTGLSCLPLASFQLDFTFSFPLGLLISVKKATCVWVWRCLARWEMWYQFVGLITSAVCSLGSSVADFCLDSKPITQIFNLFNAPVSLKNGAHCTLWVKYYCMQCIITSL